MRGKGRRSVRSRKGRAKKNVGKIIKSILSYPGRILKGVTGGMRFAKGGYGAPSFRAGGFRNQSAGAVKRRASSRSKRIANVVASSARGSRSRAAVVHAARSRSNSRLKGGSMTHAKSSRIGMARTILLPAKLPSLTPLEKKLESFGVKVDKWVANRSNEICHVEPASQHARWLCVPEFLEQGVLSVPATVASKTDYAVKNCDLFDIYREHCQGTYDSNTAAVYVDPKYASNFALQANGGGTISTGTQTAAQMFGINNSILGDGTRPNPSASRGYLHVREHMVRTQFENVSTIDAFLQEYELVWSEAGAASISNDEIGDEDPAVLTVPANPFARSFNTGFAVNIGYNPTALWTIQDPLFYGPRLGGAMLMQYFMYCKYMIGVISAQGTLGDSNTSGLIPSRVSVNQLACHTRNDPMQALPPRLPRKSGYRLVKVGAVVTLKPGQSIMKVHPARKSLDRDVYDFPVFRTKLLKDDSVATVSAVPPAPLTYIPKHSRVFCFRVWGDMIQDSVMSDLDGDRDWQTGSPRVMCVTDRRMATRISVNPNVRAPYCTPYEFDATVDKIHQTAINDETDAPAIVQRAGL